MIYMVSWLFEIMNICTHGIFEIHRNAYGIYVYLPVHGLYGSGYLNITWFCGYLK